MAQRRAQGDASVYKGAEGWQGLVELGRGPDGRRRRKKVRGRTRAEVLAKVRAVQQEVAAGKAPKNERLTVGAFLDRWVSVTLPGTVADSTLESYADTVRLHLRPALGPTVMTHLSVQQVDELLNSKRDAGYKASSIVRIRTVLRRALRTAEREGLVDRNVAALSTAPRLRRAPGRSLTIAEAHLLLNAMRGHRLEALFVLMLAFGLRRGEALGLLWANFDPRRSTLRVTHGVKRVKRAGDDEHAVNVRRTALTLGELKTARATRTLYLSPALIQALDRHRERQDAERARLGEAWTETGLIFTSELGTMLDPDNVSRLFSRLARQAGLGHWHAHELRHSGASLMLAGGAPLHVVSEVLGHASIAITKDVYGHLVEGEKRDAAEIISAILGLPNAGSA